MAKGSKKVVGGTAGGAKQPDKRLMKSSKAPAARSKGGKGMRGC